MIIETIEYSWFGLNWLQNVAELLNDPLTCKRGHILGVLKWGRTRQRHSEQLSGSNGEREGRKLRERFVISLRDTEPRVHRGRTDAVERDEEQRSINGLRESSAQYLTSSPPSVWMCDCVFFFIPPFLSNFLSSFFHSSTFSSLISSHLPAFLSFYSFPPFLLPSPFLFLSSSLPPTPPFPPRPLPPPYPLPPFLSSRYRPHRGVLRLPLRRLRSDHGATASPTEHRDHAAHRQDDRGGKNTLMSSSFCMLSHVVPVTILHQLNVLKFKYPEIN